MTQYFSGNAVTSNVVASFLTYMVYGYQKNIVNSNFNSFFYNYPYDSLIPANFDGTKSVDYCGVLLSMYRNVYPAIFTSTFINSVNNGTNVSFNNYLDSNSLFMNWAPSSKLTLYCGTLDTIVPRANSENLCAHMHNFTSHPENITCNSINDLDHAGTNTFAMHSSITAFCNLRK